MSKQSFLDILRRGKAPSVQGSAVSFLQDDFMVGGKNKVRDWDNDIADNEKDVEFDDGGNDGDFSD